MATPFLTEYWLGEDSTAISPATSELVDLVEELWDHEFDELTYRLTQEAAAAADDRFPQGEEPGDPTARERFLEGYLEPLHSAAERLFETVAEAVSEHDLMAMSESELDSVLGSLEVGETDLSPTFEGFLGGLLEKAKKLAKGAVKIAKKGIAAVGSSCRSNPARETQGARPAAARARTALRARQASARPAASSLTARQALPSSSGIGELDGDEVEQPATADVRVIQQEFDLAAASLLFAADETEGDLAVAEIAMETQTGTATQRRDSTARQRFTDEVTPRRARTRRGDGELPSGDPARGPDGDRRDRPRAGYSVPRAIPCAVDRALRRRENSAPCHARSWTPACA